MRSKRGRRRRDGSQYFPLFVLFVLFGQAKRTLKEKKHKVTFLLSYFSMTKSTKSQQGGLTPSSFRTSGGVHELVARAMRGECVRQRINRKSVVLRSPQSHTTTRANKVHEKAEQIRARIVCTPAESARRAWIEFVCGRDRVHIFCFVYLLYSDFIL